MFIQLYLSGVLLRQSCIYFHDRQFDSENLIFRSLDLAIEHEVETIEALRLLHTFVQFGQITSSLLSCLISLASERIEDREKLTRASLEILSEVCKINAFNLAGYYF